MDYFHWDWSLHFESATWHHNFRPRKPDDSFWNFRLTFWVFSVVVVVVVVDRAAGCFPPIRRRQIPHLLDMLLQVPTGSGIQSIAAEPSGGRKIEQNNLHPGKLTAFAPENHLFERENHLHQNSMTLGSMLTFQGVQDAMKIGFFIRKPTR